MNDQTQIVEIFSGTNWEAEMIKDILLNEGIETYVNNEVLGTLMPWVSAPGELGDVQLMISSENLEKAKPIVDAFQANREE